MYAFKWWWLLSSLVYQNDLMLLFFKNVCYSLEYKCIYLLAFENLVKDGQCDLYQGLTTSFCKGPVSRYFRLCKAYDLHENCSELPQSHRSSHRQCINEWVWLRADKTYLRTPKFELHIISCVMKYSFDIFFQPFKNVKTILNSKAIQKQGAGLIWSAVVGGL